MDKFTAPTVFGNWVSSKKPFFICQTDHQTEKMIDKKYISFI